MGRLKLPKGCNYPDCFNCTMPDCILPDDVDLLGDCDIDLAIEELTEERDKLLQELQAQGLTSKDSARYKTLGNRICYLRNRDKIRMREKRKYHERKRSP
jgi:hypothetical protein